MMQVLVVREKGECQFDEREKMVDESRYLLSTIRKYVLWRVWEKTNTSLHLWFDFQIESIGL